MILNMYFYETFETSDCLEFDTTNKTRASELSIIGRCVYCQASMAIANNHKKKDNIDMTC